MQTSVPDTGRPAAKNIPTTSSRSSLNLLSSSTPDNPYDQSLRRGILDFIKTSSMDFDLLSGYLDGSDAPSPDQLLFNLQDRQMLTHEQPGQNLTSSENAMNHGIASLPVNRNHAGAVITKIEDIFESIADCILEEGKELVIPLKSRPKTKNVANKDDLPEHDRQPKVETRNITFPSKSPQEAWKFTALLRILELSHEALVAGIVTTKRDIYYRDPELFMKQAVVDRYVDDLAYTLGIDRDGLNVGLVTGCFSIVRKDGSETDYSSEPEGVLIPSIKDINLIQVNDIRWVLVIEKEATFRTLAANQYWKDSMAGQGVLITAKGYPDIQTRQFLRLLNQEHPKVPIFALVDYDPDGIGIMSTYKHGSIALAHQTNLAVPCIRWLGVRSCDFLSTYLDIQGLLTLTARDRRIAMKMLGRSVVDGEMDDEWKSELQVMLMLNIKAEIQIIGNGDKLGEWLDRKLQEGI